MSNPDGDSADPADVVPTDNSTGEPVGMNKVDDIEQEAKEERAQHGAAIDRRSEPSVAQFQRFGRLRRTLSFVLGELLLQADDQVVGRLVVESKRQGEPEADQRRVGIVVKEARHLLTVGHLNRRPREFGIVLDANEL